MAHTATLASQTFADRRAWRRAMEVARESLTAAAHRMPPPPAVVPRPVYDSWRRSRLQGLSPHRAATSPAGQFNPDSRLCDIADGVVRARAAVLDDMACALLLTDQHGVVLRRWGSHRSFVDNLDDAGVTPGFSVAEEFLGTSSAITLLAQAPVIVRGPEHFLDQLSEISCAGAPIRNPITRRTVGTLDFACRLADTTPLMLSWVSDLAAEIGRALADEASRAEHLLLQTYLAHRKDCRQPLITLGPNTIITNTAAARLVSAADQAALWERARSAHAQLPHADDMLTLANGAIVVVETTPVTDAGEMIGALLKLKLSTHEHISSLRDGAPAALGELVGRSDAWRRLAAEASRLPTIRRRAVIIGESGSGRLAVACALAEGHPHILDALDPGTDLATWPERIATSTTASLILRNIDALDETTSTAVAAAVRQSPASCILATARPPELGVPAARDDIQDALCHLLTVPPLRTRLDDLALLLDALTAKLTGGARTVHWMSDLVQTLARVDWPGNVAELESLTQRLLARSTTDYVGAADLPSDVLARAARRKLSGLEQAEAQMIMRALNEADGNKQQAAHTLGIARSTLYRKVRALGLDLRVNAY